MIESTYGQAPTVAVNAEQVVLGEEVSQRIPSVRRF